MPGAGHHAQRFERRDRPVRAEHHPGAGRGQVAAAEGPVGPFLAEPAGPVVGVVGPGVLGAVGGLHRGGHAQRGEPGDGVVGHRLDVLHPVPHGALPVRGHRPLHRVQDVPDRRVPDRVRRGRHAGPVELADHPGVLGGVGPEGAGRLAVAVRAFQPRGAVVDGAVHEELRPGDPPAPAALALAPDQLGQVLRARSGLHPGGDPQPQRELSALLEGRVDGQALAVGVHRVAAGEAGRRHPPEHLGGGPAELLEVRPGCDRLDQFAGGVLQQQAGRAARRVADHLGGALLEAARPVDPGQFQRPAAGQHGVRVEQVDRGGNAVQHRADAVGGDRPVAEDVRVQAPAAQPLAGRQFPHRCGQHGPDALQVGAPRQVHPGGALGARDGVQVAVGQPGDDHRAAEVEHLGPRPRVRLEAGDPPRAQDERVVRQEGPAAGVEQPGVGQDEVGVHGWLLSGGAVSAGRPALLAAGRVRVRRGRTPSR